MKKPDRKAAEASWALLPREAQTHALLWETALPCKKAQSQLLPLRGKSKEYNFSGRDKDTLVRVKAPFLMLSASPEQPPVWVMTPLGGRLLGIATYFSLLRSLFHQD